MKSKENGIWIGYIKVRKGEWMIGNKRRKCNKVKMNMIVKNMVKKKEGEEKVKINRGG